MTQPGGDAAPLPSLESLRSIAAQRMDPLRFCYLEALSQRLPAAPGEVRRLLQQKLDAGLADYAERFLQARAAARDQVSGLSAESPDLARALRPLLAAGDYRAVRRLGTQAAACDPAAPLAALNRYIRTLTDDGGTAAAAGGWRPEPELKSVRSFRETWSRLEAVDQVEQAIGRGPENAGPLNSHMLVLRSLALMRALSPDYLRRFLAHVDGLLWLEQESRKPVSTASKPARRGRAKK